MSSSIKRVLTEETRKSLVLSNNPHSSTSVDPDLSARLRNLGSRVRKNVTEGYITVPSSYQKSNSTGTIFHSANDTLRDIFSQPGPSTTRPSPPPRKRTREQLDQGYDSDGGTIDDVETSFTIQALNGEGNPSVGTNVANLGRPMKSLRKPRRSTFTTHSLPNNLFRDSGEGLVHDVAIKERQEDDWSVPNIRNDPAYDNQVPFEPMVLT